MEIHPVSLNDFPSGRFIQAYCSDFDSVARWYHFNPHDEDSIAQRISSLEPAVKAAADQRRGWAEAAVRQQQQWGSGSEALEAAALLAEAGTFAVVTGQQAGVLGGPLYTQLKALSAVRLARQLGLRFPALRFVPVFWIASGDSDFEEIRRTQIIGRGGEAIELALPAQDNTDSRIIRVRNVEAELQALLAQFAEQAAGGEFRDEVLAELQQAYRGSSLTEGFARWMARLFRGTELVVIDPQDSALSTAASPVISRQIELAGELDSLFATRNAEISAAGFKPQVETAPGETSLFLLNDKGERSKIVYEDGGFYLQPSHTAVSRDELLQLADAEPGRFVCGVMTRPIYQNSMFPLAAWLGGSAEIAYRAQTTALFDLHQQQMAPAFLRSTATLLPRRSSELLNEMGWTLKDCFEPPAKLAARAATSLRPQEVEAAIEQYRKLLYEADGELLKVAVALDPTLEQSFGTLRGNLVSHVDRLEKKITSVLKQRSEGLQKRVAGLASLAAPGQVPQERSVNLLSFLPRYGFGLIGELIESLPYPAWQHQLAILD